MNYIMSHTMVFTFKMPIIYIISFIFFVLERRDFQIFAPGTLDTLLYHWVLQPVDAHQEAFAHCTEQKDMVLLQILTTC